MASAAPQLPRALYLSTRARGARPVADCIRAGRHARHPLRYVIEWFPYCGTTWFATWFFSCSGCPADPPAALLACLDAIRSVPLTSRIHRPTGPHLARLMGAGCGHMRSRGAKNRNVGACRACGCTARARPARGGVGACGRVRSWARRAAGQSGAGNASPARGRAEKLWLLDASAASQLPVPRVQAEGRQQAQRWPCVPPRGVKNAAAASRVTRAPLTGAISARRREAAMIASRC